MASPNNFDFYKPYDKNGMYATGGPKKTYRKVNRLRHLWRLYKLMKAEKEGKLWKP